MISEEQFQNELDLIIANAVREDVGDGDHSSLACIPASAQGKAKLLVKDEGTLAGVEFAKMVFNYVDSNLKTEILLEDGAQVKYGDIAFYVEGSSQSILKAERLVLNAMQRMSAIATKILCQSWMVQIPKFWIPVKLPLALGPWKNGPLRSVVEKTIGLRCTI